MIIDCKSVAAQIKQEVRESIERDSMEVKLTIVKVGKDPASESYVKGKVKDCKEVGIIPEVVELPDNVDEEYLIGAVKFFQNGSDGIIVQLPLPPHINKDNVIAAIDKDKDVDGFRKDSDFTPCTPAGIMKLLDEDLSGLDCLIINRSEIVGRPLVNLLLDKNATVTIAHSKTKNIEDKIDQADIIVTAVGVPNFIKLGSIRPDQIVIDVSINRGEDGKLCGDLEKTNDEVDFSYTPVPGGIGLMTRAMLMYNTLAAKKNSLRAM